MRIFPKSSKTLDTWQLIEVPVYFSFQVSILGKTSQIPLKSYNTWHIKPKLNLSIHKTFITETN